MKLPEANRPIGYFGRLHRDSAPEAAKKWGISERRVQKLCEENRIPGVAKFSRLWLIPKDAEKPADARMKAERTKKHE